MAKGRRQSPNEDRSTIKNPNNPRYSKAQGNRGKQMNPNYVEKQETE